MAYSDGGYESDLRSTESTGANESASEVPSSSDREAIQRAESDPGSRSYGGEPLSRWHDDSSSRPVYSSFSDPDDPYRRSSGTGTFWAIRQFFARLFGWNVETSRGWLTADQLSALARAGYDLHPQYCNQSVSHVAERMGFAALSGKRAEDQVAYMQQSWDTLDARAAQDRANQGGLVVAGLAGHTAIVTPGPGSTKLDGFYPNVTCGGPPNAQSDGSRTAGDVWPPSVRSSVEYFTPR